MAASTNNNNDGHSINRATAINDGDYDDVPGLSNSGITLFRVVMLGQGGAGKSNIADRYCRNIYTDPHKATVGVEFQTKHVVLPHGIEVKLEIWDTSGQERYNALAPLYYREAHAALVVYDVTNKASFVRAKRWIAELRQKAFSDMMIMLVGNKVDLTPHLRAVPTLDAETYADDEFLTFAEVSAKTGFGIQSLFETLARRLVNGLYFPSLSLPHIISNYSNSRTSAEQQALLGASSPRQIDSVKVKHKNTETSDNRQGRKKGCSCGSSAANRVHDD